MEDGIEFSGFRRWRQILLVARVELLAVDEEKFHFHYECVRKCVISEMRSLIVAQDSFPTKTAFLACTSHEPDFSLSLISCNCASTSRSCVWVACSHSALIKRRLSKRSKTLLVWQTKPLIWGFLRMEHTNKPKHGGEVEKSSALRGKTNMT